MSLDPYESSKAPGQATTDGSVAEIYSVVSPNFGMIVGGMVGFGIAACAMLLGAIDDIQWPTIVFCAPAMLMTFLFSSNMAVGSFVYFGGMTILYAVYGWMAFVVRNRRILFAVATVHGLCSVICACIG